MGMTPWLLSNSIASPEGIASSRVTSLLKMQMDSSAQCEQNPIAASMVEFISICKNIKNEFAHDIVLVILMAYWSLPFEGQ